ncbi:MAG: hypothetical protein PQJ60_12550, partial [Spirochaetales bacterium]|nr:hypothetical protein [Spirochaetales bacterium]
MIKMETFEIDSIPTGLLKNSDWYYNKIPPYNHKNYSLEFLLPFNIASQGGMITYPRIRKDGRLMYRWSKYKSGDHYQHMA